ncbi:encapsulin-associated ferritin-like protein [Halanaerobacter jeridensis]|uniref:Ferritin-like protein n=1 Tax=Halanaerobacter jeridensis TaxID=706427 RepID=A0A939BRE7_9FIRM|nr:encapsulin-associated ferritin-like protein [Halanaerobacter jeridensis]MBM7555906.1 ferritin-like protein [Halanaerobacter jeridensis]
MSEYHEDNLPEDAKDFHRMIKSVMEELEAVDWYNQRAAVTNDESLKAIVEHNRDEEIEHACMGLEWLRRNYPQWDEFMREFLFTEGEITELEEEGHGDGAEDEGSAASADDSLGIKDIK